MPSLVRIRIKQRFYARSAAHVGLEPRLSKRGNGDTQHTLLRMRAVGQRNVRGVTRCKLCDGQLQAVWLKAGARVERKERNG